MDDKAGDQASTAVGPGVVPGSESLEGRNRRRPYIARGALVVVLAVGIATIAANREPSRSKFFEPYMSSGVASWQVDGESPLPTPDSTSISVTVTPECSEFGEPLDPRVERGPDQITVTIDLEPSLVSSFGCAIAESPRLVVDLGEPLGTRSLVDGRCLTAGAGSIFGCEPGTSVRWQPAGPEGVPVSGYLTHYDDPGRSTPQPAQVRAVDAAGGTVATSETGEWGAFTMNLPNGSFDLVIEPVLRPDGTAAQCPPSAPIDVVGLPIDLRTLECIF